MMYGDYLITVFTTQLFDGEKNEIEMTTHAELKLENSSYTITYNEEDEQEGKVRTRITVEKNRVITVERESSINSRYTIEQGVRHISHHVASFGSFSVGISGKSVESDMSEEGGSLSFSYLTDIAQQPSGEFVFNITLKLKSERII